MIILGKVYELFRFKLMIVRDINVRFVDEGVGMIVQYIGDFNIRIGVYDFVYLVYVGFLQDEMFFGKDFLRVQGVEVFCEVGNFKVRRIVKFFEFSIGVLMFVINVVLVCRVWILLYIVYIIEREMLDFILVGVSYYIFVWYSGFKNI